MSEKNRRSGRPTQVEAELLNEQLREAAVDTFLECGYDGASMEAIARAAGVTKQTLYSRYPDKRAVFADVIPWAMSLRLPHGFVRPTGELDLEEALTAVGREALARISDHKLVKLQRIAMNEAGRFPEFAVSADSMAWSPRLRAVMGLLRQHRDVGAIDINADEIEIAAEHFMAMIEALPWRLAEFGVYRSPEQTERHLQYAVKLFLRALAPSQRCLPEPSPNSPSTRAPSTTSNPGGQR